MVARLLLRCSEWLLGAQMNEKYIQLIKINTKDIYIAKD